MKIKESFSSILDAARTYVGRGYYVVPIPSGKNHPGVNGWQKLRFRLSELKKRFSGAGGIGLLLEPSELLDIDIDCREASVAADSLLPDTGMVHGRSGNPRSHRYYVRKGPARNHSFTDPRRKDQVERGMLIELRGVGLTVAPPSRHVKTGERIRWESFDEPGDVGGSELLRAVAQTAAAALLGRYWPTGSRHHAAMALSGMLLRAGWTELATTKFVRAVAAVADDEEISARLQDVVSTAVKISNGENVTGAPTLADLIGDDLVAKVRQWLELGNAGIEAGCDDAPHDSDLGNARRLVAQHGKDLRYCHDWGHWLIWRDGLSKHDTTGEVERCAKSTIKAMFAEASELADGQRRAKLVKHALRSEAAYRIGAMVQLAQTEPGISVTSENLDADPMLLNCVNGTIDLRTGKLLTHDRQNLCTKQVPVAFDAFDPRAKCPTWKAFLHRIMTLSHTRYSQGHCYRCYKRPAKSRAHYLQAPHCED
jgi:putative DNA primase/helicase